MHLVQVCDLLTREVRWTNIFHPHPVEAVNVLKAHDWAAIARLY